MKINQSLAPLEEGSPRSIVSASVANTLIDGANAINQMRGDGSILVTHSDSNIVIDLGCPVPTLKQTSNTATSFPYYHTNAFLTSLIVPPVVNAFVDYIDATDSATVGADFTYDLNTAFPYIDETYSPAFFWDQKPGTPPATWAPITGRTPTGVTAFPQTQSSPGVGWRDHPSGALTIGPFSTRVVVFSATKLMADDRLYYRINSGSETLLANIASFPDNFAKNQPIAALEIGDTMRFRVIETGGAYVWASGIVGVKRPHCVPKAWRVALGI